MRDDLGKWMVAFGLAALSASSAWAQRPPGYLEMGFGGRGGPTILRNPDVQKDLKLTDAQVARIGAGLSTSPAPATSKKGAANKAQAARDLRKAMNDAAKKTLELTPEQATRYDQLILQFRRIEAFYDPIVQRRLGLTDDQFRKFLEIGERARVKSQELLNDKTGTREAEMARYAAHDKQVMSEVMTVFSDEQKAIYQQMLGAPLVLRSVPPQRP